MSANENIGKFLNEGKSYVEKGDPVQASEKLYKAAEEAIKLLAIAHAPEIDKEVAEKGRWTTDLLFKAADEMGREIRQCWDSVWTLHVQGFHEMRPSVDSVARRMENIAELVKLAENKHQKEAVK
mgnify:CR=1 FL=1